MGRFKLVVSAVLLSLSGHVWAVNVNTADAKTLAKELDGVGEAIAAAIVKEREKGAYAGLDDLDKRVKGLGKKTLEKNKAKISFTDK